MIYTNIKAATDKLSEKSYSLRNFLCVVLGLIATSCELQSPPLELNDEAKHVLEMEKLQQRLEANRVLAQKEAKRKQPPEIVSVISSEEIQNIRNKYWAQTNSLEELLLKETKANLIARYFMPDTLQSEAKLIMNELVRRNSYEAGVPLLIKRVELTKNQKAQDIDVNAYNDLLTTFFSKVSQVTQLKIIVFVKKTWRNNDSFTEMAYSALHTTMRKAAKTLEIRQQVEALLGLMETNPIVMACRDVRYDAIDLGPTAYAPSGIASAGGGARE